ncbi:Type II secretion system protein E [Symmachiella dynata]|uniref:Type II secretion system protein E n=1 Tax=Symmachiella dynata TaxID=2527995 RepID=A0A517ZSE7_9PLAN|nr:GspE/PulE family protein [Symmachiella dynata]QDU45408.1 Type II secretion system protein E [Symmachiella dynata]
MDIGNILVGHGLLSDSQLETATAQGAGQRVDRVAVEMGFVSEEDALKAFGDELGMRFVDLKKVEVDPEFLAGFPAREIFRHTVLPLERENGHVLVATSDPFDLEAIDEFSSASGCRIEPVLARHADLLELIKSNLGVGGDTIGQLVAQRSTEEVELLEGIEEDDSELAQMAQQASVIKLVNDLLIDALDQHASDVHLEPTEQGFIIRCRVDGMLRVQPVPPEINQFQAAIISRLKIMARMNIAEKRLPQDGRIKLRIRGREIDVRVSIIPMMHGEGVVLRLLDKQAMTFDLGHVGFPEDLHAIFKDMIKLPYGIILVTGPTGSGKTTTLYCGLNELRSTATKIITVEDPVEYHLPGVNQIQVHAKIGMTFAAGLRSILRHDPDVILIGEIRDGETANSAIQASLTGHVVFSTLHTNDAASAFTRLVDMGVEPYLVASTVEGVLAQRLIRKLCPLCKVAYRPDPEEIPRDMAAGMPEEIYKPAGCRECRDTGYSGRTGIFELLRSDVGVRQLCVERASSDQIRHYAMQNGFQTLRHSGWQRVFDGTTSIEEVNRITKADPV